MRGNFLKVLFFFKDVFVSVLAYHINIQTLLTFAKGLFKNKKLNISKTIKLKMATINVYFRSLKVIYNDI